MTNQPHVALDARALEAELTAADAALAHTNENVSIREAIRNAVGFLASLPQQTAEPVAWRYRYKSKSIPEWSQWVVMAFDPSAAFDKTVYDIELHGLFAHPASPPVGGAVDVDVLRNAVLSCGHTITAEEIVLRRSDKQPGNALRQLHERILSALASSERSGREAVVCSVKTMKLSDGREDHFVSIRVGDREITPYRFTIKGRAEFEVAEFNWLLNGAEKPDILDWLDRTRDPNDPTEAAIRKLSEVSHEH